MALPIDLSINPELDPNDPENYDAPAGEWAEDREIPLSVCDCHVCTCEPEDQFEFIDELEEDYAL